MSIFIHHKPSIYANVREALSIMLNLQCLSNDPTF